MFVRPEYERKMKPHSLALLQQCMEMGLTVEETLEFLDYTKGEIVNSYS